MNNEAIQVCSNCVMDTTDPQIKFDDNGKCDFCDNYYNSILPSWKASQNGGRELEELVSQIKQDGKGNKYDCIIGLSGGVDSCYMTYIVKEKLGLKPLAISVDTGWNLNVANENVDRIVKTLNIDLHTITVDWDEMEDLQTAFFRAQVPYQDLPQDHAIFAALYNYASEHGIKYVLTGGNYSTECVQPPFEWVYMNDIKLIRNIHKKFGKRPLKNFPLCGMFRYRLVYTYIKGMKFVRPLNMLLYEKDKALARLEEKFGWEKYVNKHYENIFTRFYEGYWLPKKFGYDKRKAYLSSLILTEQMSRQEALDILKQDPYDETEALKDLEYIANKLKLTKEEFINLMNGENKTYRDYKNSAWLIRKAVKLAKVVGVEKRNFR
jgi:N-acetyl sugar amidotransferase